MTKTKGRVHAHKRQQCGSTDAEHNAASDSSTTPSGHKDQVLKIVESLRQSLDEIKFALDNDAKSLGVQAARLMIIEDFVKLWGPDDDKKIVQGLPYTT